jgi:hypothetical protein
MSKRDRVEVLVGHQRLNLMMKMKMIGKIREAVQVNLMISVRAYQITLTDHQPQELHLQVKLKEKEG